MSGLAELYVMFAFLGWGLGIMPHVFLLFVVSGSGYITFSF